MLIITLSLLICVLGLIIYMATKTNAELKEVGRIMFAFGLLAFLMLGSGPILNLVGRH